MTGNPVRRALMVVLLVATVLVVIAVLVFQIALGLSLGDAVYFVVTTITTVGYGDINLQQAPMAVKAFGAFLMVAGAAAMAALFGIVSDTLLRARLQEYFGTRSRRMKNHFVLCGLGNVGYRVLTRLHQMGEKVAVIERDENGRFVAAARTMKVPVIIGDSRLPSLLEEAGVARARGLIAATDEDLANLECALNAREIHPELRIVLRMFDQSLATKVCSGFLIDAAFSTSALAAPALAMAAVDPAVVGSFLVGDDLMLTLEITVTAGSRLDGMSTAELEDRGRYSLLAHTDAARGDRRLHPSGTVAFTVGDTLVIATEHDFARTIHDLNRAR